MVIISVNPLFRLIPALRDSHPQSRDVVQILDDVTPTPMDAIVQIREVVIVEVDYLILTNKLQPPRSLS